MARRTCKVLALTFNAVSGLQLLTNALEDMNRDTEELPSIMAELEEQSLSIEDTQ